MEQRYYSSGKPASQSHKIITPYEPFEQDAAFQCYACLDWKPRKGFAEHSREPRGFRYICKDCDNTNTKIRRHLKKQ